MNANLNRGRDRHGTSAFAPLRAIRGTPVFEIEWNLMVLVFELQTLLILVVCFARNSIKVC